MWEDTVDPYNCSYQGFNLMDTASRQNWCIPEAYAVQKSLGKTIVGDATAGYSNVGMDYMNNYAIKGSDLKAPQLTVSAMNLEQPVSTFN